MSGSSSSSKHFIEDITVDGKNTLYGGRIYYFNLKVNGMEGPNEIQINVVNDSGSYSEPTLSFNDPHEIDCGGTFKDMYLVKFKKVVSSQGSFLELFYIDKSFKLDTVFVGINGKHGWINEYAQAFDLLNKKTFTKLIEDNDFSQLADPAYNYERKTPNFWIVGRQFHPCDKNRDGKLQFDEIQSMEFFCDPCPSCPDDKYEDRCKELTYTQIFESAYSFKDLIDCFPTANPSEPGAFLSIEAPSNIDQKSYEKYYKDFHGTLREVLTSWCYDFGLSWYLDQGTTIKFIDLKGGITLDPYAKINDNINNLISYELDVENDSSSAGNIVWYEKAGEKKSYNCAKNAQVMLSPVYGNDYLGARARNVGVNSIEISSNADIMGSILGSYSPILRNIYWTHLVYKIKNAQDAKDYITTLSNPADTGDVSGDLDIAADPKALLEMGDLKILAVVSGNDSIDQLNDNDFVKAVKPNGYKKLYSSLTEYEKGRCLLNSGFFIVAYVNEKKLQQRIEMEKELFNFIGRYYIDEHLFRLCGITGNDEFVKNNTSIQTPDGSAKIYSKKDGIKSHPFSKFKYYKSGYLGCVVGTGNLLEDDNNLILNKESGFKNEHTSIILEREPKWVPEPGTFNEIYDDYITNKYGDLEWKLLNEPKREAIDTYSTSIEKSWIQTLGAQFITGGMKGQIKVFRVYPYTGNLTITPAPGASHKGTNDHPTDKSATQTRQMVKRIGGKHSQPELSFGLLNTKCTKISFNDQKLPDIYTPPHTFSESSVSRNVTNLNTLCLPEGFRPKVYRAYMSQSFNQAITVPKIQGGIYKISGDSKSRTLDVLVNTLTNDDFAAFSGSGMNYGCTPNLSYLSGIYSAYTGIDPSRSGVSSGVNLNIKGFPTDINTEIPSGLSQASVTISENGVFTSLTYNTQKIKSISKDLLKFNNFRYSLKQPKKSY
jgi:hypothetical protein